MNRKEFNKSFSIYAILTVLISGMITIFEEKIVQILLDKLQLPQITIQIMLNVMPLIVLLICIYVSIRRTNKDIEVFKEVVTTNTIPYMVRLSYRINLLMEHNCLRVNEIDEKKAVEEYVKKHALEKGITVKQLEEMVSKIMYDESIKNAN
ncbi:MAG: hypothetical protein J0L80_12320 [Chitinophagales bacterium]|nr:hypothetical protein [Chitinophagales bacterium]